MYKSEPFTDFRLKLVEELEKTLNKGTEASNSTFILMAANIYMHETVSFLKLLLETCTVDSIVLSEFRRRSSAIA